MSIELTGGSGQSVGLGRIEATARAIASIARRAATESYGVVGLSFRLHRIIAFLFHWERAPRRVERGLEVTIRGREVTIDLYVVVEYGTRLSEVAANVARGVQFAVEHALGSAVVQVNVNIQGVRVSRAE